MLGSFRKGEVLNMAKDVLVHKSRLIDEKYVLLIKRWNELSSTTDCVTHKFNPSFEEYVKNVATGCMVKEGSRKYKELYPETKKKVGQPLKPWDPLCHAGDCLKDVDSVEINWACNYVDKISNRFIKVCYANGNEDEFLVSLRKQFLINLLTEGLSKSNVVDLLIGKETEALSNHASFMEMGVNSKTGHPIDPAICSNKLRLST